MCVFPAVPRRAALVGGGGGVGAQGAPLDVPTNDLTLVVPALASPSAPVQHALVNIF